MFIQYLWDNITDTFDKAMLFSLSFITILLYGLLSVYHNDGFLSALFGVNVVTIFISCCLMNELKSHKYFKKLIVSQVTLGIISIITFIYLASIQKISEPFHMPLLVSIISGLLCLSWIVLMGVIYHPDFKNAYKEYAYFTKIYNLSFKEFNQVIVKRNSQFHSDLVDYLKNTDLTKVKQDKDILTLIVMFKEKSNQYRKDKYELNIHINYFVSKLNKLFEKELKYSDTLQKPKKRTPLEIEKDLDNELKQFKNL